MANCFCFIPAKLASTRLKEKNIAMLDGKELISYSIKAAQNSNLFGDEIIVSSESQKVLDVAAKYGAKTPYVRNEELAKDPNGVKDVLLDFLNQFPQYKEYDHICILLPTAPLLESNDIIASHKELIEKQVDLVLSVTETSHSAYRALEIENGLMNPIFPDQITKKSQELPPTYRINGAVIFLRTDVFLEKRTFFTDKVGAVVMPADRSVDIDSSEDLEYARFLIQQK